MIRLALDEDPPVVPGGDGPYRMAAKWYYRWFGEGTVREVPTPEEIAAIERGIPGVRIDMVPSEGGRSCPPSRGGRTATATRSPTSSPARTTRRACGASSTSASRHSASASSTPHRAAATSRRPEPGRGEKGAEHRYATCRPTAVRGKPRGPRHHHHVGRGSGCRRGSGAPTTSDRQPVPAILEAIPYRKNDLTSTRDAIHHPYIAGHGYACVRVDLRGGTGESEGVLLDEYLEREQRDAEEVLAWLAAQPWCDGRTGMMGISWGGFAALQVAARRPPSLGAIVIASFTDDRYADDMHYVGGAMLSDNLAEAGTMFAYSTCPPDPPPSATAGGTCARTAGLRPPLGPRMAAPPGTRRLLAARLAQ